MTPNQSPHLGPRPNPTRKKSKKSKLKLMGARAKLKLTNTQSTDQPPDIINAKTHLKAMKQFGNEIGELVTNLYNSQTKSSEMTHLFCDKLTSINITNKNDKFAIYMNNIGRITYNIENENEKQLTNMRELFVNPINDFNNGIIENCKELKLKLRRKKAEYDMILKEENKLRNKQHTKNVNLANVYAMRKKSKLKLDKLELIREEFLYAIKVMGNERIQLILLMKQFMLSYKNYSNVFNNKLNKYKNGMYYIPPNMNNKLDLDSDTEDINDNEQTVNRFNEWSVTTIILKEGWINKKGDTHKKFEKRWFKLFSNKIIIYFQDNQSKSPIKGHINLIKVVNIVKKSSNLLEILSKCRIWILQFESTHDRDIWYEIINGITITEINNENIENKMNNIEYINENQTDDEFEVITDDEFHEIIPIALTLTLSKSANDINLPAKVPNLSVMPSLDELIENKHENENKNIVKNEPVKYLTLAEIVEEVTSPQTRGTQNQLVLILTYCLYSTREELLNVIFNRLSNVSDHQIQIKVFSLLRTWLKTENDFKNSNYNDDDDKNVGGGLPPFALHFTKELMLNIGDNELLQKLAKPIISQISQPPKLDNDRHRQMSLTSAPIPRIPKYKNEKDLNLNNINPTEIARQICLIEYNIFSKIKPEEFLKQKSKKKKYNKNNIKTKLGISNEDHNVSEKILQLKFKKLQKVQSINAEKESNQPNIDKIKEWFNKLVVWTQIEILGQGELSQRIKIVNNLFKICDKLEKYNNISSLCAIRAGLCSSPIHRLRKTWDNISKKSKEIKHKLDELFKLENNQKNLRERISIMNQPAIPHIGIFLGDIIFIHDGNNTFNEIGINWNKIKLLSDRINWISMFQQSPFIFQSVPIINKYLQSKMKIVPEDFLYKLSKSIETPQKKKTV